jgi:hypothetical protein
VYSSSLHAFAERFFFQSLYPKFLYNIKLQGYASYVFIRHIMCYKFYIRTRWRISRRNMNDVRAYFGETNTKWSVFFVTFVHMWTTYIYLSSEIFDMDTNLKNKILWVLKSYNSVRYRRFGGKYRLYHQDRRVKKTRSSWKN